MIDDLFASVIMFLFDGLFPSADKNEESSSEGLFYFKIGLATVLFMIVAKYFF